MGKNTFELEINGTTKSISVDVFDFVPRVTLDIDKEIERAIPYQKDILRPDKIELSKDFVEREYIVPLLCIEKDATIKLELNIAQGNQSSSWQDENGKLKFDTSNKSVTITAPDEIFSYGDTVEIEIEQKLDYGEEFSIEINAVDNDGDWIVSELEALCGKVVFTVIAQDAFTQEEIDKLLDENALSQTFNSTGDVIGNGYCINTADRGLGALLGDSKNFYTEPNYRSQGGNGIKLYNSTSRAKVFQKLGYVKRNFDIVTNNYNTTKAPTALQESLLDEIYNKLGNDIGYHVFYFSMHGEYHVMLLLVDYRDKSPDKIKFSILDQDYVDERNLKFENIDKKFVELAQVLWEGKNHHAKNILMWKIQRK